MVIENEHYLVEAEELHGSIRRIFDKTSGIELIAEPRLAGSFQLLVPLADTEGNYLIGAEQRLTEARKDGGDKSAGYGGDMTLTWAGPLSSKYGSFDIGVTMRVQLVDRSVRFSLSVRNGSPHKVAEVWYPMLGGMTGIGERAATKVTAPFMGWAHNQDFFNDFRGMVELGTPTPEYFFQYTTSVPMPWVDLYNPDRRRGVYLACHDTVPRFGVMRFELRPGIGHGRKGDTWPHPQEVGPDIPVGVIANWVSFPYTAPKDTFEGPPVVVRFHDGDWHDGALIYRAWFESQFPAVMEPKGWFRSVGAFQMTMLMLPEGNVLMTYRDIPRLAKDALAHGVKTLLISGWDKGGHDNMYPFYEPDPRLGTWEELEGAIRECHRLGARVIMFANLQPVDCTTEWYRKELHRYRSMDPWGWSPVRGWGMGTLGARMGATQRPMFKANPLFPEFRQIITRQMVKLAEIGADGVHLDKLNSFGLDFNPDLTLSPDRASCQGVLDALGEMADACRAVRPDFALSVESAWDRTLPLTDAAWVWHPTWENDHLPVYKFTFPQWLPAIAVAQPYDYNVVNTAVRYGYQLLIGVAHYTSSMEDPPMKPLSAYIGETLRIREELKDTIFLGDFLDTLQATVEAPSEVRYSVHRNLSSGKRACVLVNYGAVPREARVDFEPRASASVKIYEPFAKPRTMRLPAALTIPPERFAILVE